MERAAQSSNLEVVFVHARRVDDLGVDEDLVLPDLSELATRAPDLVVEGSHPDVVREWGEQILRTCSFMPLSVSALADDQVRTRLVRAAGRAGTSLYLSRGALVGLDGLTGASWDRVTIEFVKNPAHIDFSSAPAEVIERAAGPRGVLFEGTARQIARIFPRNVNAMTTLALGTVGLDALQCRMVSDPEAKEASLKIEAVSVDGHRIEVSRSEPMVGVSGEYLFDTLVQSMRHAAARRSPLEFV